MHSLIQPDKACNVKNIFNAKAESRRGTEQLCEHCVAGGLRAGKADVGVVITKRLL